MSAGRSRPAVDVTVRSYKSGDAVALADIFFRSVREAALADYTPAQVAAWLPARRTPASMDQKAQDGRTVLVAVNAEGRVVAYIDLEQDGHIDHLFCLPEAVGHGVATTLYVALEGLARERGMTRLFVEASESARRVFERHGFTVEKRRDLVRHGVALHNYAMFLDLEARGSPGD